MAIKVIKHGETKFRLVCPVCGCEFEYEFEDLVNQYDIIKQVKCPDCGEWLTHREGESVKKPEKDITWKFPKPGEPIPCDKSYRHYVDHNYPYAIWTSNIPDWPDCETCPNKPDFKNGKPIIGDTPCTWCKKNQPYCTSINNTSNTFTATMDEAYISPDYSNSTVCETPECSTSYTTEIK